VGLEVSKPSREEEIDTGALNLMCEGGDEFSITFSQV
jgi:hypothetical protein